MKRKFILLTTALLAGVMTQPIHAEQKQLREDISRFWGVTEAEIDEISAEERQVAVQEKPVYAPKGRSSCQTILVERVVKAPEARPSMEASQRSDERKKSSHFGLRLFDGLPLFNFVWGTEESHDEDSMSGRR